MDYKVLDSVTSMVWPISFMGGERFKDIVKMQLVSFYQGNESLASAWGREACMRKCHLWVRELRSGEPGTPV